MPSNNRVTIYTDGACKGNPGRGGWAAIVECDGAQKVHRGKEPHTTNNRMELMAAIKGLEAVDRAREVVIYSDSTYLVNTMTRGWKRNANQDLWERLDRLVQDRTVSWKWVRSHNGNPGNEMADRIASSEAGLFQGEASPTQKSSSVARPAPAPRRPRRTPGRSSPASPRRPRRTGL